MPTIALIAVLLAAAAHATWNLFAKKAAGSRHFVWFYSVGGAFIAAYTLNDAWAVKGLALSPFLVDFTGNLLRAIVLVPHARGERIEMAEVRRYAGAAAVVSVLGPLGYILVLYAMRVAPVSHVAPARELATLAGAYMGSRVLRERTTPERIFGALCIVCGVVSLSF